MKRKKKPRPRMKNDVRRRTQDARKKFKASQAVREYAKETKFARKKAVRRNKPFPTPRTLIRIEGERDVTEAAAA